MKIKNFLILITLVFQSCNDNNTKAPEIDIEYNPYKKSVFYDHIDSYIKRTWEILFFDENGEFFERPYYSYYFFEKDSIKYFTSWISYNNPRFIEYYNPSMIFFYSSINVNGFDAILITQENNINEYILDADSYLILKDSIPLHPEKIIYDGRWYIESYKYYTQDSILVLEKIEPPIVDFLGDLPEEFW